MRICGKILIKVAALLVGCLAGLWRFGVIMIMTGCTVLLNAFAKAGVFFENIGFT